MLGNSSLSLNPDIPEARAIHEWRVQFHGGTLPATTNLSAGGEINSIKYILHGIVYCLNDQ